VREASEPGTYIIKHRAFKAWGDVSVGSALDECSRPDSLAVLLAGMKSRLLTRQEAEGAAQTVQTLWTGENGLSSFFRADSPLLIMGSKDTPNLRQVLTKRRRVTVQKNKSYSGKSLTAYRRTSL
jgi:hypothetical protein